MTIAAAEIYYRDLVSECNIRHVKERRWNASIDECGKENTIFNWILSRRQSWSWLLMAHDQLCFTRTEHLLLNMGILLVECWHQFVDLQNRPSLISSYIVPFFLPSNTYLFKKMQHRLMHSAYTFIYMIIEVDLEFIAHKMAWTRISITNRKWFMSPSQTLDLYWTALTKRDLNRCFERRLHGEK